MRTIEVRVAVLLLLVALAATALAHNGEVPMPIPGAHPSRSARDSPRRYPTGGPRSDAPNPPEPERLPEPEPNALPGESTPGGKLPPNHAAGRWTEWWRLNRDRLADPTRRRQAAWTKRGEAPPVHYLGSTPRPGRRGLPTGVPPEILAALREAAESSHPDLASSALVALGKARDGGALGLLLRRSHDSAAAPSVREAALLALGLLGTDADEVRDALRAALLDERCPARERACTALGAGLGRRLPLLPALTRAGCVDEAGPDAPALALVAIGLLGDEIVVPDLMAVLHGPLPADAALRACAAAGLGKTGSRAAIVPLARALSDPDPDVRRQAALALGAGLSPGDEEAGRALQRFLIGECDPVARGYAAVSLGESGWPPAAETLLAVYGTGNQGTSPYAALGLGLLLAQGVPESIAEPVRSRLRSEFERREEEDLRGALAVSLGLAGDKAAVPLLCRAASEEGGTAFRGHVAVALGLLGEEPARPVLRALLLEDGEPRLSENAAYALGLLGDRQAALACAAIVEGDAQDYRRACAAFALSYVAEPRESTSLVALLSDPAERDILRAVAAMALGRIVERDPVPTFSRFTSHLSPMIPVQALRDALDLF